MKNLKRHLSYYDKGYITSCKITSTNIPIEDNTEFDNGVKNRLNKSIRSDLIIDTDVASKKLLQTNILLTHSYQFILI